MFTKEEHTESLRAFEVDQLLALLQIEAKKNHDSHYTIFFFFSRFRVCFGTPEFYGDEGKAAAPAIKGFATLKEAIIDTLVGAEAFSKAKSQPNDDQNQD